MSDEVSPIAGALTVLSWDGTSLVAGSPSQEPVRLRPAALYHYRHEVVAEGVGNQKQVKAHAGLAARDADGLVMLDLPGDWDPRAVHSLTVEAGIPVVDARGEPPEHVRAVLAGRAPGWRRLQDLPPVRMARWRKPVVICAGVAGLALMVYLSTIGAWGVWRAFSGLGRLLMELVEAKWLILMFSPVMLVLRPVMAPVRARAYRKRLARGEVLGPPGGPWLEVGAARGLAIRQSGGRVATVDVGGLLLYRYEDLTGLFVRDAEGVLAYHLPGPWPAEDVHRFAEWNALGLEVLRLSREEYVNLVNQTPEASP